MRRAYVTFLMRNDSYLPGALVLAYALKFQSKYDRICLVTNEIPEKARSALRLVYDKVIPVNDIRIRSAINGGRNDRNHLLTRFEALRLGPGGGLGEQYDKIILLDADVLPLGGYDELFSLSAPAGIIMENKAECYSAPSEISGRWSWHSLYEPVCPHGARIPKSFTDRVRDDNANMGVNSGLWILSPSVSEYKGVLSSQQKSETAELVKRFPWPEMQLATLLWSGRWTNVDIRYCSIGGYPHLDNLCGTHFAGLKPWQVKNRSIVHYSVFPDFKLWYRFYAAMYWSYPALRENPVLKRLWDFCKEKLNE